MFQSIINFIISFFRKNQQPIVVRDEKDVAPISIPIQVPITQPVIKTVPQSQVSNPQYDVILRRGKGDAKQTPGMMTIIKSGWSCNTLELPWLNNQHNISCIPTGLYKVSLRPFKNTTMYQILNVFERDAIFIHNGDFFFNVLGCILQGINPSEINGDGEVDVTSSVPTVADFKKQMGNKDFILLIV